MVKPYTGFLNTETCFNTVSAPTLNNVHIQKVELSFFNCWQFLWNLLERGKWIFLPRCPPPSPFSFSAQGMFIPPTSLQNEWVIWKSSFISQIVPSLSFVLVLISRAPLDSKEKEHGQQRNRVTQRTASWDQLQGIWWLSASMQLWRFCWLEKLTSSKGSGQRIIFKAQK